MAALCLAELNAYLASRGAGLLECLNSLYSQFGFYLEMGKSLVMEGADGAAQIAELTSSFISAPPEQMDGSPVVAVRDFSHGTMKDAEGDPVPAENLLFIDLADGRSFAVRPSGTEPKIKFYLFAHGQPGADLTASKEAVSAGIDSLWQALQRDCERRKGKQAPASPRT